MHELTEKIRDWLERVSREDALPPEVEGLYIGMLDGDETYLLRLAGSAEFDPDNAGWACSQDFTPELQYLDTGVPVDTDWREFERAVVQAVRSLAGAAGPAILRRAKHVSVGFDSGGLTNIT